MSKLSCKIGAVQRDEVEVEIEGRKINLPKSSFPSNIKEKDCFQLFIYSSKNPGVQDKDLTKSLLEEILNGE